MGHGQVTQKASLRVRTHRFWRAEAGTLTVFALMLFMLMVMMGGIAVDVMRYEARRTSLQNTLDRSTLAAAALDQTLNPRAVVDDYFLKAGLQQYLTSVTVTQGMNYREVAATALADTEPMFLHLLGIQQFNAPGRSAAEQRVNNVEVMMVLDVSGSMNQNSKLANLQSAANQFVATVLGNDPEHKISIGMVPFNGQINLGAALLAQYKAVDPHGAANVNCVDLPAAAYADTRMSAYGYATSSTPADLPMTANADTYSGTSGSTSYIAYTDTYNAVPNTLNQWCPARPGNIVRLPQQSIPTLQGYINGLTAVGATSINAGMKWGLAFLDPATRPTYTSLLGGLIPTTLAGRPFEYDDGNAMKVIVLMTDGENFPEERVNPYYKGAISPIYRGTSDNNYSIFHASKVDNTSAATIAASKPYYVPHLGVWQVRPWNGTAPLGTDTYIPAAAITGATMQTWPQIWTNMRLSYVAWQFYARPLGGSNSTLRSQTYTDTMNLFRTKTDVASGNTPIMDAQMQAICTMAKTNNVIIYGIAFEAPTNGQAQIRACSTDGDNGSHYFNASGLQIATAFSAIANNISQLRLTQ